MKKIIIILALFLLTSITYAVSESFIMNTSSAYTFNTSNSVSVNNVTVYNNSWLSFNGSTVVGIPVANLETNISVFSIFKKFSGGNQAILRYNGILLRIQDSGIRFWNNVSGGAISNTIFTENNTWVVYSVSLANKTYMEYFNGNRTGVGTMGTPYDNNSPNSGYIGLNAGAYLNGSVEEIRVYNKTLTFTQMTNLYNESVRGGNLGIRVPVLMYHSVGSTDVFNQEELFVNLTNFTEQMNYLHDNNYHTITFKQYYDWKTYSNFSMPSNPVIISFDDGRKEPYNYAYPVMKALGFVGVAAITNYTLNTTNCSVDNYRMCTNDLNDLINNGWEIASHSVTHPTCPNCFNNLTLGNRTYEFNQSQYEINRILNYQATTFIFPGNSQNGSIRQECLNYYTICTAGAYLTSQAYYGYKSTNISSEFGLNRISVYNDTTITQFKNINLEDGLVSYYKFKEGTGNFLYDFSGYNRLGLINKSLWQNDSILLTIPSTSYSTSGNTFQLLDSYYNYVYGMVNYDLVEAIKGTVLISGDELAGLPSAGTNIASFADVLLNLLLKLAIILIIPATIIAIVYLFVIMIKDMGTGKRK